MKIVILLVDQLGGELTYRNDGGAEFEIALPPQNA